MSPPLRRNVVPDVDNANLPPKPTMTNYHPFDQEQFMGGGRFLVHARSAPYALVQPITRIVHKLSRCPSRRDTGTADRVSLASEA